MAAPARPARTDAEPDDTNAAARPQTASATPTIPTMWCRTLCASAANTGVDVFRVFDSLNWVENMRVAMDAVVDDNKVCEGTICYTGDILNPERANMT